MGTHIAWSLFKGCLLMVAIIGAIISTIAWIITLIIKL